MTISEKIFSILKEKKMTQKEFSKRTGITEAAVSDWKKRGTNPTSEKILKICEVLEITPNELLMDAEGKRSSIKDTNYVMISKDSEIYDLIDKYGKLDDESKEKIKKHINFFLLVSSANEE